MKSSRHSYLITLGHVCTDINQGALPAIIPFLVVAYDLSYAAAAVVMLANCLVSAIIQPLFGYLGDKVNRPWFMSLGILFAAGGIVLIGFVHTYELVIVCALVTGTGVALFHPEGGKLANVVAGENKGAGISNFSVGGNLGFAIGPLLAIFSIMTWGMQGTVIFLIPAILSAALLFSQTKAFHRLTAVEKERIVEAHEDTRKDDWVGFMKVTFVNTCRAIIGYAMVTFIPLYWIAVLGQPQEIGSLILVLYSLGGATSTFFGGRIADRIGFKQVVLLGVSCLAPLLLIFILTSNVIVATILIMACSVFHSLSYAPMVALGQSYLPNRIGFASGISLGVVVSVGGAVSPGIGAIGDMFGLTASISIACALAFLSVGLTTTLFMGRNARDGIGVPKHRKTKESLPEPTAETVPIAVETIPVSTR